MGMSERTPHPTLFTYDIGRNGYALFVVPHNDMKTAKSTKPVPKAGSPSSKAIRCAHRFPFIVRRTSRDRGHRRVSGRCRKHTDIDMMLLGSRQRTDLFDVMAGLKAARPDLRILVTGSGADDETDPQSRGCWRQQAM